MLQYFPIDYPEPLVKIAKIISEFGGESWLVGGAVRHLFMEHLFDEKFGVIPDWDVEVHNIPQDKLEEILGSFSKLGTVEMVGRQYGVYNIHIDCWRLQFNLPTIRVNSGEGHKDEKVIIVPDLSLVASARRRNFTINSMMVNIITGELVDIYHGASHCARKFLFPVSQDTFGDDPLRPLNVLKLGGIYDLWLGFHPKWVKNIPRDGWRSLPKERIWTEWREWASRSNFPSAGIECLSDIGWLPKVLDDLKYCPQDSEYHPEGCVYEHTLLAVNEMDKICKRDLVQGTQRIALMLAALLHDIGKPRTTIIKVDGDKSRIASPGHEVVGEIMACEFLTDIGAPGDIKNIVMELVRKHMFYVHMNEVKKPSVLKFLSKLKYNYGDSVFRLIEADSSARSPLPKGLPDKAREIKEISDKEHGRFTLLIRGQDFIDLGIKQSPRFAQLLAAVKNAQIRGEFDTREEALEWIKKFTPKDKYVKKENN